MVIRIYVAMLLAIAVLFGLMGWAVAAPRCMPAIDAFGQIARLKGKVTLLEKDDLKRALIYYSNTPPAGPEPVADAGYMIDMPDGSTVLMFGDEKSICNRMTLKPEPAARKAMVTFILGTAI